MQQIGNHTNIQIDEDLLRHMILNSLRSYNVKFRAQYGEMVIACDGHRYWRKELFPYYKVNRKKDRDASEIDWHSLFAILNKIREELKDFFPYRVIHIDVTEADDIIGTLCHEFGNGMDDILIISGDKDFKQLQSYMKVKQYDPVRKKWMQENDPERYLKEHIIRGDRGDGIPNFLSSDNSLALKIRQKPVMQAKLDVWLDQEPEEFCDPEMLRRYRRNEALIDLTKIPEAVQGRIMDSYNAQTGKNRSQLFNYFITYRLKNLMTDIDQF